MDQHWGRAAWGLWGGQMLHWMAHPALGRNSKGDLVFPFSSSQVFTNGTCLLSIKLMHIDVDIIST